MRSIGIVAEYNPFHNGHAYSIKKARESGAESVVAVMSGSFVQRGEPAIFDFETRVRAALACGADLVIQLPVVYAVSGAQRFARASTQLLDALGVLDTLVFGSECGDTKRIIETARLLDTDEFSELLKKELAGGISFALARENALRKLNGECADIIASPNDILGVEYVSSLLKLQSELQPFAIRREGVAHDGGNTNGEFASASRLRELLREGADISAFVPERAAEIYMKSEMLDMCRLERAILYKMRTATAREIALAPDVSEGIENRIVAAAKEACTLDELYSLAKTKRYSHARIRRIILNTFLNVTEQLASCEPPYIRVAGFNENGAAILKKAAETARLPILTKTADIAELDEKARGIFAAECRAGDIAALCLPDAAPCGTETKFHPILIK